MTEEQDYKVTHSFYIAGVKFHQMAAILADMKVGNFMSMVPESDNKFDPNAVRLYWGMPDKEVMCGFVPKKFSAEITALLEIEKPLECVIVELNPSAPTWEQCKVEIREVVE